MKHLTIYKLLAFVLILFSITSKAQEVLSKNVSINVQRQRLDNVLEILSNKGSFYFSYNSNIIKRDSLVSIAATNKTVKHVLNDLFGSDYEFKESGNYIIIRKAPVKLAIVTKKGLTEDKVYTVSGYVLNDATGEQIKDATIYEKAALASAITNEEGYFKMRLKNKAKTAELTVSKQFFQDTTFTIEPRYNQQLTITILPLLEGPVITISPEDYFVPDSLKLRVLTGPTVTEYTYIKTDSNKVEKTAFGNLLLSSRQKIQTLNLRKYFTERPFQISLTPGLGTHGKLSGQVINNFSLNVFGGYSGGVNGFEVGGLFNIDKKDVQYAQLAGVFNIVGGNVKGLQIGGVNNTVLQGVKGVQVAGVSNIVKKDLSGFQLSGVYNHVSGSVTGFQLAGVGNFAKEKVKGNQVAGVLNFSNKEIDGVQISGVFNYAKKLKGVQVGLINIADTSQGYSIGLINIILKGYHKLALSTNEVLNTNFAFKTGSTKLYSILQAGMNIKEREKAYSFGYGMGSEFKLGNTFSINPEVTAQYLYLGAWDYVNILSKAHLNLNIKLGKYISLFGGPSFAAYYSNQDHLFADYKRAIPPTGYKQYKVYNKVNGWIGWNAGINFF
ncbi:MAG TPA: STN and carboxypeptidase regulatory-like domain-containing protein [Chitinophagaceae bacterium]|nr:STN and carboxypeptidase regulatory-like domain-containing protein [Chitinophagaceae bacterium]